MGRVVGLFDDFFLKDLRLLLVGMVLKKGGLYRLIYYLFYFFGVSVNDFIDKKYCLVRYFFFDEVLNMFFKLGYEVLVVCLDIKNVFRLLLVYKFDF